MKGQSSRHLFAERSWSLAARSYSVRVVRGTNWLSDISSGYRSKRYMGLRAFTSIASRPPNNPAVKLNYSAKVRDAFPRLSAPYRYCPKRASNLIRAFPDRATCAHACSGALCLFASRPLTDQREPRASCLCHLRLFAPSALAADTAKRHLQCSTTYGHKRSEL